MGDLHAHVCERDGATNHVPTAHCHCPCGRYFDGRVEVTR